MFVQGKIFKFWEVILWVVAAFLLGIELGHWLFLLTWGVK